MVQVRSGSSSYRLVSESWLLRSDVVSSAAKSRPARGFDISVDQPRGSAAYTETMLSIGKLAAGQAGYYLEQAHGPVTRAGAVSSGVEDYYLGGPEAAGDWMGGGAPLLGLRGTVGEDALR